MSRTPIRETLQVIFEEETDQKLEVFRDDMLLAKEFNLDSVDYVTLIMRVEEHFHIRLTNAELSGVATVGSLVDLVESKVTVADTVQTLRRAA